MDSSGGGSRFAMVIVFLAQNPKPLFLLFLLHERGGGQCKGKGKCKDEPSMKQALKLPLRCLSKGSSEVDFKTGVYSGVPVTVRVPVLTLSPGKEFTLWHSRATLFRI